MLITQLFFGTVPSFFTEVSLCHSAAKDPFTIPLSEKPKPEEKTSIIHLIKKFVKEFINISKVNIFLSLNS